MCRVGRSAHTFHTLTQDLLRLGLLGLRSREFYRSGRVEDLGIDKGHVNPLSCCVPRHMFRYEGVLESREGFV